MSEELPDENEQQGSSTQNLTQTPAPTRERPLFPIVLRVMVFLSLIVASVAYTYISIAAAAIIIFLGLLQIPSVSGWVEVVAGSIYKHMNTRLQRSADTLESRWRHYWTRRGIIIVFLLSVIVIGFTFRDVILPLVLPQLAHQRLTPPLASAPVYTMRLANGSSVGLSYGLANFDTADRIDGRLKDEAAQALIVNNPTAAKGYWKLAVREDETDGEACIYQENQNMSDSSSKFYVTIVVVVTLTGKDQDAINRGRSILQGACVAQKEYNSQRKLPTGLPIRLQIANIDDPTIYGGTIAKLISQMTTNDTTIIGVTGQLADADDLVRELNKDGIPMLSSTALYSTMEVPFLFSIAPSLQREAQVAVTDALPLSKQVGLLYNPTSPYSMSLATFFKRQFLAAGGTISEHAYTSGLAADTLPNRVDSIMSDTPAPKLIYLAGSADDASFLVPYLHEHWPGVQVMGGDVLYQYVHSSDARANFNGLLFTSFAFHDEWQWQGRVAKKPAFFDEYAQNFDAQKQHSGNPFTYRVPDSDAILAYDAAGVFLQMSDIVATKLKQPLTFKTVGQVLQSKDNTTFSGISGQISFSSDGEPQEKAVVMLESEPSGIQLVDLQGRYP